jgi:hypothetical protein
MTILRSEGMINHSQKCFRCPKMPGKPRETGHKQSKTTPRTNLTKQQGKFLHRAKIDDVTYSTL